MGEYRVGDGADHDDWRAAGARHHPRTAPAPAAGRAARNAVDCALWDLQAQRGQSHLLGVALPNRVVTAQTVVIGTPEQMAASAAALWEKGPRC
jgi:L-alanine-DL-glutamate epimerase-like enolase superfamily enzyme